MRPERRNVQRRRPGGLSYFQFETGSGGIVLDASEAGLAFQAADAVQQLGPNRICISPNPEERIELNGDVVWMDRSKKAGGLRFLEPSVDTCKQIREWLKQPKSSEVSRKCPEFPLPTWASQEARHIPSDGHRQNANPLPSPAAPPLGIPLREDRPTTAWSPAPSLPPFFGPDLISASGHSSAFQGRFVRSIASAFLICVMALGSAVLLREFRPEIGNSLIHLGQKLSENTNVQSHTTVPISDPVYNGFKPPSTPEPNANTPSLQASGVPVSQATVSSHGNPETVDTADNTISSSKEPVKHRQGFYYSGDRSAHARGLWSAVEAGDSSAEVELARLYLKGDGVPRNCEQARVLLRAAARGGNLEARHQLQKLYTTGCRVISR
jgi:hypothetical protein